MKITVDDRERDSGIITLLKNSGFAVTLTRLSCCDYIIGDEIYIERKTAKDFLVSIIDGRLFTQARMMKKQSGRSVFLVEGNPYNVDIHFNADSIKGAILSLQVVWYIPVLFSKSKEDTCKIIRMLSDQLKKQNDMLKLRCGYRPRKIITRQLFILQGLPHIGPLLSKRLLEHFGSVRHVMRADVAALSKIEGIGSGKARKICEILDVQYKKSKFCSLRH